MTLQEILQKVYTQIAWENKNGNRNFIKELTTKSVMKLTTTL